MNSPLTLVQELRGIRGGPKQVHSDLENLLSQVQESRREWQTEVDQAQRIFRDLLATISQLSGVELPATALDVHGTDNSSLRIGFKTLKERVRNDLEAFSSATVAELGKQTREKGQAVLEPLQKEMTERLDNLSEEFRAKLLGRLESDQTEIAEKVKGQIEQAVQSRMDEFAEWIKLMCEGAVGSVPEKVQSSLEPHVHEVSDRMKASLEQQLSYVLRDYERSAKDKIKEFQTALESTISSFGQQTRQVCEQNADLAMKSFSDRLNAMTDDAAKKIENKTEAGVERNLNHFRQRLTELSRASQEGLQGYTDQQEEELTRKLHGLGKELQKKIVAEVSRNIDHAAKGAAELSLQQLHLQLGGALEHSKDELKASMREMLEEMRNQMGTLGQSARESLSHDAATFAETLTHLGNELKAVENKHLDSAQERLSSLSQTTLNSIGQSVKQVAEAQLEEVRKAFREFQGQTAADYESRLQESIAGQHDALLTGIRKEAEEAAAQAMGQIKARSEQVIHELSGTVNKEVNTATALLKDWAHQTTSWAETSIRGSLDTYKNEVAQFTDTVLEQQRKAIHVSIGDLQDRLEQAALLLKGSNGSGPEHA